MNLKNFEQYGRRQNLELHSIPKKEKEDASEVVVNISDLLGVELNQSDISIAHRLRSKPARAINEEPDPPAIIARCVRRSMQNQIHNCRNRGKHRYL